MYCCATTPSELRGAFGRGVSLPAPSTKGAPEYKPVLTYSLMANSRRARAATAKRAWAASTLASAASNAPLRIVTSFWSADTVATDS